jgi:hypothetical protein
MIKGLPHGPRGSDLKKIEIYVIFNVFMAIWLVELASTHQ